MEIIVLVSCAIGVITSVILLAKGCFYGLVEVVALWNGMTKAETVELIHDKIQSKKVRFSPCKDRDLCMELWNAVRLIIGEARFADLEELSKTVILWRSGEHRGCHAIGFVVPYENDNEKKRIEGTLSNILKGCLEVQGMSTLVVEEWITDRSCGMPMIILNYGESRKELKTLENLIVYRQKQILKKYQPCVDEEDDLCD